jgi:hypothetical protein
MLNEQIFDECFSALLTLKQIPVDQKTSRMFYQLFKNHFSDGEFKKICGEICREATVYNKYPDPKLFYDKKVKITEKDEMFIACEALCSKVQNYLLSNFIPESMKDDFNNNLTENERHVLIRHGGISALWYSFHREGYSRGLDSILRELREDFENVFQIHRKSDLLAIEQIENPEMAASIRSLTSGALKKICN